MAKVEIKKINKAFEECKNEVSEKVTKTINKKLKNVLEKEVEKQIKKTYSALGWDCYGIQSKLGCEGGVSDLILVKDGKVLLIEVKSPVAYKLKNHNLSLKQIKFLKQAGGFVATIIENEIIMEKVE